MEAIEKYFSFWVQSMLPAEVSYIHEQKDCYNHYILHYLVNVFKGEELLAALQMVLKNPNILLNQQDLVGNTAIQVLIEKIPISTYKQCFYNITAIKAIDMLIKAGADLQSHNHIGETALHIATKKGDALLAKSDAKSTNVIAFLISKGVAIESRTMDGNTPLHLAAAFGQAHTVEYLMNLDIDRNPQNIDKETPLHYGVLVKPSHPRFLHNPVQVVETLVKYGGVELDMKNNQGYTPIQMLEILFQKKLITPKGEHGMIKKILEQGIFKEQDYCQSQILLDELQTPQALDIICSSTPTPWIIPSKSRPHPDNNIPIMIIETKYADSGTVISERRLN